MPGQPCACEDCVVRLASLADAARFEKFLVPAERDKAVTIAAQDLRARFVVSRGLRRQLLAGCTGLDAAGLRFEEKPGFKPRMKDSDGWDFSHSHAGDHVAVAVRRGPVGIDLEAVREVREMTSIVARYFHSDEASVWRRLPENRQKEAFFILWSAREAAVKCLGLGLAKGLSITRVEPMILDGMHAAAEVGSARFDVHRLNAPPGFVLIVAKA